MKKTVSVFLILSLIICYNAGLFNEIINLINFKKNEVSESTEISENNIDDSKVKIENFSKIRIGDSKESVINKLNNPVRIDESEYDFLWYIYKNNKDKFLMVGIENNKVVALFSNSINSTENENIYINKDINYVRKNFIPLKYKVKGNIKYKITSNDEYDIIYKDKKYLTVFYDKHDENKIWAYEIISSSAEDKTENVYPKEKCEIEESFMLEIIDITNCTRYRNNLPALKYSKKATQSATKHSIDMRDNNYFDHINLKDETPFDRMKKEEIYYTSAGENIAAGQTNAMFVHNGWMNSLGHRKNILGDYKYIGVGVVFGGHYNTYFTENFFG